MNAILPRIYEEATPPDGDGGGEELDWMPLERTLLKKMVSCAEQGKIFFPVAEFADSDCMTPEIDGENATVRLPNGETHTIPVATLMEARACALKGGLPFMMPEEPFQCWQLEEREVAGQKTVGVLVNTPFTHALPAGALDEPEKEKGLSTAAKVGIGAAVLGAVGLLAWGLSGRSGGTVMQSNPMGSTLERIRASEPAMNLIGKTRRALSNDFTPRQREVLGTMTPERIRRYVANLIDSSIDQGVEPLLRLAILRYPNQFGFTPEMREQFRSIGLENARGSSSEPDYALPPAARRDTIVAMHGILPRIGDDAPPPPSASFYDEAAPPDDLPPVDTPDLLPIDKKRYQEMVACAKSNGLMYLDDEGAGKGCGRIEVDGDKGWLVFDDGSRDGPDDAAMMLYGRDCLASGGFPEEKGGKTICHAMGTRTIDGKEVFGALLHETIPVQARVEPEKGLSTGTMVGIGAVVLGGLGLLWWGLSSNGGGSSSSPALAANPVASLERIRQRAPQGMQIVRKISQVMNEGLSPEAEAREVRQMLVDAEKLGLLGYIDTAILHYPYEVGFSDEMRQRFVSIGGPLAQVSLEAGAY